MPKSEAAGFCAPSICNGSKDYQNVHGLKSVMFISVSALKFLTTNMAVLHCTTLNLVRNMLSFSAGVRNVEDHGRSIKQQRDSAFA